LKDFLVIKDPEVAKLLADPNRRRILHNLRHQEMTAYQMARVLGKNVSPISYHLNALEKAGLVEQSRVSIRGNLIERYYRATAKKFIVSYTLSEGLVPGSEDIAEWTKEICKEAVSSLEAFGIHISPEETDKWLRLMEKYSSLEKLAYEEVISKQFSPTDAGFPALMMVLGFLAHAYLSGNPEYLETMKEISMEVQKKKELAVNELRSEG